MKPLVFLLTGIALGQAFLFFPYISSISACGLFALAARRRRLVLAAILAAGFAYALIFHHQASGREVVPGGGRIVVDAYCLTPPAEGRKTVHQDFDTDIGVLRIYSWREFEMGRRYVLSVRFPDSRGRDNPGGRPARPLAFLDEVVEEGGYSPSLKVSLNRMRASLNGAVKERLGPEKASLVMAITTGAGDRMPRGLWDAFRRAGVAHLLSISGTHFGLFSLLLFGFFKLAIERLPTRMLDGLALHLSPAQAAALLSFPFMVLYLGISGGSIPSVRSFIMVGLFLAGVLLGRKGAWLNSLLIAAVVIVLFDPGAMLEASFQLSFVTVLFIGAGMDSYGSAGGPIRPAVVAGYFRKAFVVSVFALLGASPLAAAYFNYFSLVSLASNLVVTPVVCFVLVPMSLFGSFAYLLTGYFPAGALIDRVAGASIYLVKLFAAAPYSSMSVAGFPPVLLVFYYSGFLLLWVYRRKVFLAAALVPVILYAVFSFFSADRLSVTFLATGRTDASVVGLPDGKTVVVDTGRSGWEVTNLLRLMGRQRIDALVLTHGHPDHTGGAYDLLENFETHEIWDNGRIEYGMALPEGLGQRGLSRGDVIEGDGYRFLVLHPHEGYNPPGGRSNKRENNSSLVFRLEGQGMSVLFSSDIEREAAADIAGLPGALDRDLLRSDVLKVQHHGLRSGYDPGFLEAVDPEIAVVTGPGADEETTLALRGRRVLVTGRDGAVKVEATPSGPRVKSARDSGPSAADGLRGEFRNLRWLFGTW